MIIRRISLACRMLAGINPPASLHGCGQIGKHWGQYKEGVEWDAGREREVGRGARCLGSFIVYHDHL